MSSSQLAIDGGPKTVTNKLVGWPNFSEKAIKSVEEVLRSGKVNYWTGPRGMEFEKKYAEWQGSKYAISVATGTASRVTNNSPSTSSSFSTSGQCWRIFRIVTVFIRSA